MIGYIRKPNNLATVDHPTTHPRHPPLHLPLAPIRAATTMKLLLLFTLVAAPACGLLTGSSPVNHCSSSKSKALRLRNHALPKSLSQGWKERANAAGTCIAPLIPCTLKMINQREQDRIASFLLKLLSKFRLGSSFNSPQKLSGDEDFSGRNSIMSLLVP